MLKSFLLIFITLSITLFARGGANDSNSQLAQKLSNPISELISVPIEYTYDSDIGPTESGKRSSVTFKPVIPFSINDDWILISRTIVSETVQDEIFPDAGPTAVVLKQSGPWTYGVLANHLWSFAGDNDREHINQTYFDQWIAYTTKDAYTYSIESEPTYTWNNNDWGVPVILMASKVTKLDSQILSIGVGAKYWADKSDNEPKGLGFVFNIILLLPR